jgi:hypothetical protein
MPIHRNRRCDITFTFATPEYAMDWFEEMQKAGAIQPEAALYQQDGIDVMVGDRGTPGSNRLVVRRNGDRPKGRVRRQSEISDHVVVE